MKKVFVFLSVLLLGFLAEANPLYVKGVSLLYYHDYYNEYKEATTYLVYYDKETRGLCTEANGTVTDFLGKELGFYTTQSNEDTDERTYYDMQGNYLGKSSFYMDDNRVFGIKYYNSRGALVGSFSYRFTYEELRAIFKTGFPPLLLKNDIR